MNPRSIEFVLPLIAAGVALAVAVSLPAVSYLNGRQAMNLELITHATALANRVTEFISGSPVQWENHDHRLNILLEQQHIEKMSVELRDRSDAVIIASRASPAQPAFTLRQPVYDYGQPVGHVVVASSLRPLLIETGWMALLGLMLAIVIYFPLRLIPLRALRQSQESLRRANSELEVRVSERTADLKLAIDKQSQSEATLRATFDQAAVGIGNYCFNAPLPGWIRVNQKFCEILGYSEAELLQLQVADITPPEDCAESGTILHKLEQGEFRQFARERRFLRKDGRIIWARVCGSVVTHLDGRMTEREKAEAEVRRLNVELERRVEERTHALSAANDELEAFSYTVSHDLRAPVRVLDGYCTILMEDYSSNLDVEVREHLECMHRAVRRMDDMIDGLLTLARIAREVPKFSPIDLAVLAGDVLKQLSELQPQRKVEFNVAENMVATGDRRLLRSVFENLLGNAWKFTSKVDIAHISLGVEMHGAERVFYVRDNGAGFNTKYAKDLFAVFKRLHRSEDFEGTGVGLATVQRIIACHGGRIWANSEVGQGATFYFTLPKQPEPRFLDVIAPGIAKNAVMS